jgi:site-specific DNA recombinase
VTTEAPELRIVTAAQWAAVSERRQRFDGTRMHLQRRSQRLLSGIRTRGECGLTWTVIGDDKWGCTGKRQRGNCTNDSTIKTRLYESRVLTGLTEQLLHPDVVSAYVKIYHTRGQGGRSITSGRDA